MFVSPSHGDLEKVRRIRNELERRGHNPLLFFLKCLEADDARRPELIRDEINARTFYVLCNTRASRRPKWVKQEIELVKQVTKRPHQTEHHADLPGGDRPLPGGDTPPQFRRPARKAEEEAARPFAEKHARLSAKR